jgi:hypothetical protein
MQNNTTTKNLINIMGRKAIEPMLFLCVVIWNDYKLINNFKKVLKKFLN